MKRAIRNLLDNAVKYGKAANVAIQTAPKTIEIVIDDEGPGIPEQELSRVFDPFYRLEESRSRETGGVGLGLAIAQSIVQAHRGETRPQQQANRRPSRPNHIAPMNGQVKGALVQTTPPVPWLNPESEECQQPSDRLGKINAPEEKMRASLQTLFTPNPAPYTCKYRKKELDQCRPRSPRGFC